MHAQMDNPQKVVTIAHPKHSSGELKIRLLSAIILNHTLRVNYILKFA